MSRWLTERAAAYDVTRVYAFLDELRDRGAAAGYQHRRWTRACERRGNTGVIRVSRAKAEPPDDD
jgi:hypothetical protein